MSGFTNFLGAVAGQVATRLIMNKVAHVGLGQREPGGYVLPVQIPGGAEVDRQPGEDGAPPGRFRIPNWLFFTGYGALLWYAAKATTPVVDLPDLGEGDLGSDDLLFPGLKRELTHLDTEDAATSDDPIEACLERAGWKLDRVDELRQSIFQKDQVDIWETPEPLTRSEGEILEAIEDCMQRLESQYGSLEAAGVGCSVCDGNDPDLGAVQREMFDPEQEELTLFPGPTAPKHMQAKEGPSWEPMDFWFHIPKGKRTPRFIPDYEITTDRYYYETAEKEDRGKVYMIEAMSRFDALNKLEAQLKAAREYEKEYGQKQNKFTPWFQPTESGGGGYRILPNIMAHPDLGIVQREMFDPEQMEFDPVPRPTDLPKAKVEALLAEYLQSLQAGQSPTADGAAGYIYGSSGEQYKHALMENLRSWGHKNWRDFQASMFQKGQWGKETVASLYEYLDSLEVEEPANMLDACVWIMGQENCQGKKGDKNLDAIVSLIKHEGYHYIDDLHKTYKLGRKKANIPGHRKSGQIRSVKPWDEGSLNAVKSGDRASIPQHRKTR